jgi:hydroxyisourate hydrolase
MSLSTHVLDTAHGRPAAGVAVTVMRDRTVLREATTDANGRASLLGPGELEVGAYELVFGVGDHFAPEPAFYDAVTVRFVVEAPHEHHHVPLLVSPWAYSTYRGS